MKLEEIEKLVNSRKYEHRIILYQDNGEDVDIEGYVHWLIEEVKRLRGSFLFSITLLNKVLEEK